MSPIRLRCAAVAIGVLAISAIQIRPASAFEYIIGFEDATSVPTSTSPSTLDISNTFGDAYPGDTVEGVLFSDDFSVFSTDYTNNVGGSDLYGPTDGNYAITNTAGGGDADTGPGDPGISGLTFTTPDVLQSVSFSSVDYGNSSSGADQVTVVALNGAVPLTSVSLSLVDGFGNPITTLIPLDTSAAFDPYAGQITGYEIDQDEGATYEPLNGGGNYVADDFAFDTLPPAVPEASPLVGMFCGISCLLGLIYVRRRQSKSIRSSVD